jgi:uncharacterized protein YjbJ (UPF0337 family)
MRTMSASNVKTKTTISWNDQARKLKQKFATLTDQDLYFEQGKMEEMIARLQAKVGKSKHEIYQLITKL